MQIEIKLSVMNDRDEDDAKAIGLTTEAYERLDAALNQAGFTVLRVTKCVHYDVLSRQWGDRLD